MTDINFRKFQDNLCLLFKAKYLLNNNSIVQMYAKSPSDDSRRKSNFRLTYRPF